MKKVIVAAALGLALGFSGGALAKDVVFVKSTPVSDKPTITIDPAKAYVLLRADMPSALMLVKDASAEDQVAYGEMRTKAFGKARARYAAQLKEYELMTASKVKSKKPIEPNEANFEFTPFAALTTVSIGPVFRFAKQDGGVSTYLQELTPGTYRIYGPIGMGANSAMVGTCFCMGSVRFDAKAGEIVDMGRINFGLATVPKDDDGSRPASLASYLVPATPDMVIDPRLKSALVRPAAYRPAGKLPNFFGLTVSRMPAMPGVMRYDRDRIVDLTVAPASAAGQ